MCSAFRAFIFASVAVSAAMVTKRGQSVALNVGRSSAGVLLPSAVSSECGYCGAHYGAVQRDSVSIGYPCSLTLQTVSLKRNSGGLDDYERQTLIADLFQAAVSDSCFHRDVGFAESLLMDTGGLQRAE